MLNNTLHPKKVIFFYCIALLSISCAKDSDLLTEYVVLEDALSIDDVVLLERGGNGPNPYAIASDDDDRDGVLNEIDDCPFSSFGSKVNSQGCSAGQYDTDGDGVNDDIDQCAGTETGKDVNNEGCPLSSSSSGSSGGNTGSSGQGDEDSDGVPDDVDDCPSSPAGATVNSFGCAASQYDTDSDGITDNLDQCPNTPSGQVVNSNGCSSSSPNGKEPSNKVLQWKRLFDEQKADDQRQLQISLSGDGGDIYWLDVSPYVYMFQVTGEDSYMNFAIQLFQNVISTANDGNTPGDGYLGWRDDNSGITNGVRKNDGTEVALAESRGMRTVARMLWVLSNSPTYLSKRNNQNVYQEMLSWFERNVWEKWESRGIGNLYRSNTHMSSHWGQIAWFLNRITGRSKYRNVYENWSFNGFPSASGRAGSNMRNQIRNLNTPSGAGYVWAGVFNTMSGSNDVSHANAEVELMVLGAEMGDYWTADDMSRLINSFDGLIMKSNSWENNAYYIDGSGSDASRWDQGWIQLGRFSQQLQSKLENAEVLPSYFNTQKLRYANMAYNQAYLENNLLYPETR